MRGAWIEITFRQCSRSYYAGRSPCGERGLKCLGIIDKPLGDPSLPMRGAWIEITTRHQTQQAPVVAPHAGSVD